MTEFQLQFFGGLTLTLGEQDVARHLSVKAQGLLCYLACTARPQTRLVLAGMFWGDKPEVDALRSLRVDLTKMRKYLAPYIDVSRLTLAFTSNGSHWIDTETFNHHLRLVKNSSGAAARIHLREAAQLYTGDFLDGYQAGDAYGFEEWMLAQRENYRASALSALEKLIEMSIDLREFEAGIDSANQLLRIDPWHEAAHRSLMWLFMQNGQRGAALRQYEICRTVLEDEVGVEPEEETVQLWQQIKSQEGTGTAAITQPLGVPYTSQVEAVPFQAPPLVPYFSGRDAEIAQLKLKIEQRKGVEVICIAGMGGVGKSSLSTQAAHQLQTYFQDGVLWADAASDPATIAERWAAAYGYDFRGIPRLEERLTAVREMLAEKQALIIIDGVDVAARVKPLIPTVGRSVVVFTTRNADLAYVLGADLLNLDVLTLENGRFLLSSMIGTTRIQAEQVSADVICQALQNLPLALTIAGQYLVARPRRRLEEFQQRLEASNLLGAVDTEGIVRASFDISWTALDPMQQRVFALLAVFNGRSFTAQAMAHIAGLDYYVMQDHLDTLSARSLLIEQGSDYYRQHALLFHFADEKLSDKRNPALRMVAYYSGYTDVYGTDYQKLSEEWGNLDAAIHLMASESLWQTLFRTNQNLNQAWFAQGFFDRAQRAYQLAYQGALVLADDAQIAENLFRQGLAATELGQLYEARAFFEKALMLFEEQGDAVSVSDVQYEFARIYIDQSDFELAKQALAESFQVKSLLNDQRGLAQVKYRQARLHHTLSDHQVASKLAYEAVGIQENLGEVLDLIRTLRILVLIHSCLQEFQQAQDCALRALRMAQELNDRGEIASALYSLAEVERRNQNYEKALSLARESLVLLEQMGDVRSQGAVKLLLTIIYRNQENYAESIVLGEKALVLTERVGDKQFKSWVLANMGWSYLGLGESQKAKQHLLEARKIGLDIKDDVWVKTLDEDLSLM